MDYQTSVKQVDYYNSVACSFDASDLSQKSELWRSGLAATVVVSQSPYDGRAKELPSDAAKAVKGKDFASGVLVSVDIGPQSML